MFEYGKTFVEENEETLERLRDLMGEKRFNAALVMAPLVDEDDDVNNEEEAA